jgi:hypothetical protein
MLRVSCERRLTSSAAPMVSMRSASSEKSLTLMLIVTSALYILGNFPFFVLYMQRKVFNVSSGQVFPLFVASQFTILFLLLGKIFVYYSFNYVFRDVLNSYFSKFARLFEYMFCALANKPVQLITRKNEFSS